MRSYDGVWPGVVENNTDPNKKGRLQVRVPQVFGSADVAEKISTSDLPWAWPCFPFTGNMAGLAVVPEVGAGVWVMFVQGDPHIPVWIGGWYSSNESLGEHAAGYRPAPEVIVLKSQTGHILKFDDSPSDPGVVLKDASGQGLTLSPAQTEFKSLGFHNRLIAGEEQTTVGGKSSRVVAGEIEETTSGSYSLSALAVTIQAIATFTLTALAAITLSAGAALTVTAVGALQIIGTSIVLGVAANAQKLCNKSMMDLYNGHTHNYSVPAHISGSGPTTAPTQQATEDTHTTKNVRAS